MKLFRKILFWTHLLCGVIGGVIILVMSVTGVLLTYEKQMIVWADTRNIHIAPPVGAARLPIETLLAKARESQVGTPISITARAGSDAPMAMGFSGGRTLYLNPYTGEALGGGAQGVRNFFHVVTDWHRWLGREGAGRATGRAITGACNLMFLFIVVSGLYLWFPRNWSWSQFKNILWFRRGLPSKARDFNWHNVIGFWSCVPLFLIVLSGVVISYQWAGNLVYRVAGENPPAPPARPANSQSNPNEQPSLENLSQAWTRAEQFSAGWQTLSLRLPNNAEAPLAFTIDHGMGGEPHKRATLTLERKSGEVVKWEGFSRFTAGRKLRSILRFAHTGEVLGFAGQTIAGIVSLGAAVLVWTGLALSWRRWRACRAPRIRQTTEAVNGWRSAKRPVTSPQRTHR
ncbi:MAG: PepSY domain-containing protein [Acidobacteria bacterium]|nr:PepSY domain-containing protein [Acidobacteriota bacterium]